MPQRTYKGHPVRTLPPDQADPKARFDPHTFDEYVYMDDEIDWEALMLPKTEWSNDTVWHYICNPHTKSGLPTVRIK